MKSKSILILLIIINILLPNHAKSETRPRYLVRLVEHTYDDQLYTVHRGYSVDYRSTVLIKFPDSLSAYPPNIRLKATVVRKNKDEFEIPLPGYSLLTDSGTVAINSETYDSSGNITLKESYVQLKRWAVEPGDLIHLQIYEDEGYSHIFERHVRVKKHGLQGDVSFPILSVQRGGGHPGTLGAGLSYTGRYIHRDSRFLDKFGWGGNISLLDFDPDQKIEIGLGFVITFPDDILQLGVGKNLTINHDSGYYFFGVNLLGIKEKLGW